VLQDEPFLDQTLSAWEAYLETLQRDYEILLVIQGGEPMPADEVSWTAAHPRVRLLRPVAPNGLGAALRAALEVAQNPLFFHAACDPAYQPSDLGAMIESMDHVHVAAGRRPGRDSWLRGPWSDLAYRWILRLVFGVHLTDADCPFKLFRRDIFARIPIQSDGPFVHAEILAKANFLGHMLTEVPISYPAPIAEATKPLRERLAGAMLVFRHPDFGPAVLPEKAGTDSPAPPEPQPAAVKEDSSRLEVPGSKAPDATSG
jgi:hypothetical protein